MSFKNNVRPLWRGRGAPARRGELTPPPPRLPLAASSSAGAGRTVEDVVEALAINDATVDAQLDLLSNELLSRSTARLDRHSGGPGPSVLAPAPRLLMS